MGKLTLRTVALKRNLSRPELGFVSSYWYVKAATLHSCWNFALLLRCVSLRTISNYQVLQLWQHFSFSSSWRCIWSSVAAPASCQCMCRKQTGTCCAWSLTLTERWITFGVCRLLVTLQTLILVLQVSKGSSMLC